MIAISLEDPQLYLRKCLAKMRLVLMSCCMEKMGRMGVARGKEG